MRSCQSCVAALLAMLFAIPVVATAQTALAAATADAPNRLLSPVLVTGNPLGSELFDMAAPAAVLSGERLQLNMQPTLGEIVNQMVGVYSSYYGPNASRPVIRGLDGDRIQVLQNGLASFDASGTSVDHAVAIDTLTVRRIEVVRGPASLLYGPTAIGGVVNVIDSRIPLDPVDGTTGGVDVRYGSAANDRAASAYVEFATPQGLQFHLDGFKRLTSDLRIPGYANSPQLRATLPADDQGPYGRLPNSASDSSGGSAGIAYVGSKGSLGAAYTQFDSDYGTVAETDVTIRMKQTRLDVAGDWREPASGIKDVAIRFAQSDYEHTEFEGGEAGTTFKNKGWQGRIDLTHRTIGPFAGAVGVQAEDFTFSALGEEGFLPLTHTRNQAAFVYEEVPFTGWKLQFGGRYDHTSVAADADVQFGPALTRTFNSGALSAGVNVALADDLALVGSAVYTQRPPNYQELFADGPHLATGIAEVGDRTLGLEKSVGFDVALRKRGEAWSGSVGAYYNRFSNFITLVPTGATLPEFEVPIYQYSATPALIYGIEIEGTVLLGRAWGGRWDVDVRPTGCVPKIRAATSRCHERRRCAPVPR